MFKGSFNRTAFIIARLAQSVDHRATNLKVLGSSPTLGKNFYAPFEEGGAYCFAHVRPSVCRSVCRSPPLTLCN